MSGEACGCEGSGGEGSGTQEIPNVKSVDDAESVRWPASGLFHRERQYFELVEYERYEPVAQRRTYRQE